MKSTRNTVAKTKIQEFLHASKVAVSQNDIQENLPNLCDRVTFYRILDRLVDEGFAHKIVNTNGTTMFAVCKVDCNTHHNHNHIHFSCVKCSQVTCLEDILPKFDLPQNYKIEEVSFTISGTCPNCH
jgi:Fur family transcriptional regulator, ferric uptake regulator